jgi:hypothetical protein
MSAYAPPIENVPIFDSSLFSTPVNDTLTQAEADKLYLKFPLGQGAETIPSLIVSGAATTNGNAGYASNIIMSGTPAVNYQEYPDGTKQYTAYTGTATNANNVLANGATAGGTYPVSYLPVGTTTGTYHPNNFDSAGNHFTYNPSTNAFSVGATTNGRININGTGGNLTIAGTGTAISCPNATAVSLPNANTTTNALTCPTINHPSGVNLQFNGSTKLTTTNTGVNCALINNAAGVELQYGGATKIYTTSGGVIINGGLAAPLTLNYAPSAITSTDLGYTLSTSVASLPVFTSTYQNLITYNSLPVGVWSATANLTYTMSATGGSSTTIFLSVSTASGTNVGKWTNTANGNGASSGSIIYLATQPAIINQTIASTPVYVVGRCFGTANTTTGAAYLDFVRIG